MQRSPEVNYLEGDLEYISRIQTQFASLSKKHKKIANYIFRHQKEVVNYSINTIAKKIGVAPSTITRFCQALSFKGFSELKVYIDKNMISTTAIDAPIQRDDSTQIILQKLMKSSQGVMQDTLRTLSPKAISHVADSILAANTINIYGQSGGYISALYAQQMLLRVGILSQAFNDNVDMRIAASTLKSSDVAIGIGYSGESRSVIDALTNARNNRATVVAITANPNSTMAKLANHVLLYSYSIPDDLLYLHLGSICEIAIIGALQAEILRHPSRQTQLTASKHAVLSSRVK
ncbi:MAG: hypothetical protein PWQ60_1194 [Thermoanaerobacteraceae bacterium]|jgi:DNA-binding MurR/RpiR family transcriptional regulator|nr:hypothetical protein [Thermoanaerobacteraceae bacterium]